MPLKQCKIGSKSGWKWGDSGKCYASKKDAIKQGVAIEGPEKFKQEASRSDLQFDSDVQLAIASYKEPRSSPADKYIAAIADISKKERDNVDEADFGEPKTRKYPVRNQHDLNSAVKLAGKTKTGNPDQIRKRLTQIAKRKGLKLPDSWTKEDKSKSADTQYSAQQHENGDNPSPRKIKIPVRKVGPKPTNNPTASPLTRAQKMPAKYLLKKALTPYGLGGA